MDCNYKIAFISNYFNHHQKPFSDAVYKLTTGYRFIATSSVSRERLKLGYKPITADYVISYSQNENECQELIDNADIVIIGSAPDELIENRLKSGKLTFKYSERFYKTGFPMKKFLRNAAAAWLHHGRFQKYPLYMLCSSAFTAADCAKFGNYKNRCYKWGYLTEVKKYIDVEKLISAKKPASILWVARLIEWKHPDASIRIAKKLKENGYKFELNIIGTGVMEQELKEMISDYDLENEVHMLGSMKPEQVREHMEQSRIFLFTSDRNEGWGAVLNESMNSACAVVASSAIGSVPFLLKDGENGLIYKDGDEEDLYRKVKLLLENNNLCCEYGRQAYLTMTEEWSPQIAAERFIELSKLILSGVKQPDSFASGPCSKAEILRDDWYINEK